MTVLSGIEIFFLFSFSFLCFGIDDVALLEEDFIVDVVVVEGVGDGERSITFSISFSFSLNSSLPLSLVLFLSVLAFVLIFVFPDTVKASSALPPFDVIKNVKEEEEEDEDEEEEEDEDEDEDEEDMVPFRRVRCTTLSM